MDYQKLRKVSSMFNAIYNNAEKGTEDDEISVCIDKLENDLNKFDKLDDFTDK